MVGRYDPDNARSHSWKELKNKSSDFKLKKLQQGSQHYTESKFEGGKSGLTENDNNWRNLSGPKEGGLLMMSSMTMDGIG